MTANKILSEFEERAEKAEHLATEFASGTKRDELMKFSLRKLISLEDDAWKVVSRIDEHLEAVRKEIQLVNYYDEFELSTDDKLRAMVGLDMIKDRIVEARRKLTDIEIQHIVGREKNVMLAASVRRGGGPGDCEEG